MALRRSKTIQDWWPTTQALDLVEGSVEAVAAAVHTEVYRFVGNEPVKSSWESFADLNAAFKAAPEFELLSRLGASPWSEEFYALPGRCFVMRRIAAPSAICRRRREDVLNEG